jgi:hypothetical protein
VTACQPGAGGAGTVKTAEEPHRARVPSSVRPMSSSSSTPADPCVGPCPTGKSGPVDVAPFRPEKVGGVCSRAFPVRSKSSRTRSIWKQKAISPQKAHKTLSDLLKNRSGPQCGPKHPTPGSVDPTALTVMWTFRTEALETERRRGKQASPAEQAELQPLSTTWQSGCPASNRPPTSFRHHRTRVLLHLRRAVSACRCHVTSTWHSSSLAPSHSPKEGHGPKSTLLSRKSRQLEPMDCPRVVKDSILTSALSWRT